MTEQEVEQAIQAKGLRALRLIPAHIDAAILREAYHRFCGTTLTVCALTLRNGHIVISYSRPASPKNSDEELGREGACN